MVEVTAGWVIAQAIAKLEIDMIAEVVLIQVVYPGGIPSCYLGPFLLGTIAAPAGQYNPYLTSTTRTFYLLS